MVASTVYGHLVDPGGAGEMVEDKNCRGLAAAIWTRKLVCHCVTVTSRRPERASRMAPAASEELRASQTNTDCMRLWLMHSISSCKCNTVDKGCSMADY